jgi:hypothetical protein
MSGIDFNSRISNEPYHIYYDLNIINNDTTGQLPPPALQFTEIRANNYLQNPTDYFASVVRFSLETPTLPVVIPQVVVGASQTATGDENKTIYTITLEHPSFTVVPPLPALPAVDNCIQEHVIYVPQSNSNYFAVPAKPVSFQDIESDYYNIYTYQPFIDMINTALKTAWARIPAISTNATIDTLAGFPANAPYLYWDNQRNVATFCVIQEAFETPSPNNPTPSITTTTPIKIWFNAPLYTLFSSFISFQNGYGQPENSQGRNYQILFPNTTIPNPSLSRIPTTVGASLPPQLPITYLNPLITLTQEYPTTPLWNPIQSITFTTSLLPIAPSLTSVPILFGKGSSLSSKGNNSNISNVLTDLEVSLVKGSEYKPNLLYSPAGEYRLFDLNGNAPLNAIELSVFWKDTFGQLHPFKLGAGCNASLKLMFRRKDFQGVI